MLPRAALRQERLQSASGRPLRAFLAGFSAEEKAEFQALCATIGRRVSAVRGTRTIEGTAVGLTDRGELELRDDSGSVHTINSGEVVVQGIY